MTSLLPPYVFALAQASQASAALANAATTAHDVALGRGPLPDAATPGLVRIPEMSGPDTPDNPFFVAPDPTAPATGLARAAIYGEQGIGHIDQALAVGSQLSAGVVTAFTNARSEAQQGVDHIRGGARVGGPGAIELQFSSAGLWLDLARNLLQLQHGGITRPPITILPVNPPVVDGGGHLVKHPPIKMTMGG